MGKISALLNPATTVILNIAIIGIVWYGGRRVQIGDLSQGEIIAFVNYINQILLAMIVIANLVVLFTKASASAARINEVLETMPSIVETAEKPVNVPLKADTPKVEFQNVSFAYAGSDEYSLEDIQLQIRRGETIGIIGGTGSGKSTLINLIPRFYEATKGAVLVDGVNVKEYPFEQLGPRSAWCRKRQPCFPARSGRICSGARKTPLMRRSPGLIHCPGLGIVDALPENTMPSSIREGRTFPAARSSG